jgi:hypothetical protein
MDIATLAGMASTALFAAANLPMLAKAIRTGDMTSYSLAALVVGNAANVIHTVYVVSLPVGPIWVLHGFYLVSMGMMIVLYLRHARRRVARDRGAAGVGQQRGRARGGDRIAASACRTPLPCSHA